MLEEDKTRKQENHRSATKGQLLTDVLGVTCPSATEVVVQLRAHSTDRSTRITSRSR